MGAAAYQGIERRRLGAKLIRKLHELRKVNRIQAHCRGFVTREKFSVLRERNKRAVACAHEVRCIA